AAGAAHRRRRARQPRAGGAGPGLAAGRGRLREPLGELLLPRARAARARAHDRRRRRRRLPRAHLRPVGRMTTAFVLLEDGTRFDGEAVAAPGPVTGEVVFNTAMSGYQEAVTDPSYAGQIITFTYPHVGNYGASAEAMESDRAHARAVIMRAAVNAEAAAGAERGWLDWLEDCGVPAITG